MTTDAASQVLFSASAVTGTPASADIDFDRLQNQTPGPTAQGRSRVASEIIYNNSKKTALTIASVAIAGANAADFSVSAGPDAPLPPNKDAAFPFTVTFTPHGDGVRTATLVVTSNAGTATANLSGTAFVNRPVVTQYAPLSFLPTSAPANLTMADAGSQLLEISSVSFTGLNPEAFVLRGLAGQPLGNCAFIAGGTATLGPSQFCTFAVGVAPGATGPASAFLTIVSNDPLTPVENVPITLSAQ
jgi:hypothetical protein